MADKKDLQFGEDTALKSKPEVKKPKLYKVILHNDHYTTMDFVVEVLCRVFHKSGAEATIIMLEVHKKGYGVCGVFTRDIAVTKVDIVHKLAKEAGFPLKCSFEPE